MEEELPSLAEILEEQTKGSFIHAATSSALFLVLSEIGNVTFFTAAVMAMRHSWFPVLLGALLGNAAIHMVSVGAGSVVTRLLPLRWVHAASAICYAIFAIMTLREGLRMSKHRAKNEYEQVENKLRKNGPAKRMLSRLPNLPGRLMPRAFVETFALILFEGLADRSHLSTLVMAANKHTVGIVVGGLIGHSVSAALAVLGGKNLGLKVNVRSLTLGASAVLILFTIMAVVTFLS